MEVREEGTEVQEETVNLKYGMRLSSPTQCCNQPSLLPVAQLSMDFLF